MPTSPWNPVPGDAPYTRIETFLSDKGEEIIRASIHLPGHGCVGIGECPNTGHYKQEGTAEKSAIALAQFAFSQRFDSIASQRVHHVRQTTAN